MMVEFKQPPELKSMFFGTMADGMFGIHLVFESKEHLSILRTELGDSKPETVAAGMRDLIEQIEKHWGVAP
jgi:hypothetical protein